MTAALKIVSEAYEVQNYNAETSSWEWLISFPTQESAESCLHRTDFYESFPPLITVDNPAWRIVLVEQCERSTVVAKVNAVMQGGKVVVL